MWKLFTKADKRKYISETHMRKLEFRLDTQGRLSISGLVVKVQFTIILLVLLEVID